jgi:hypothetical protein
MTVHYVSRVEEVFQLALAPEGRPKARKGRVIRAAPKPARSRRKPVKPARAAGRGARA